MSFDSYYEMKLCNELDIFVVFDNVLLKEFVIEDMKILIGYVWICVMLFVVMLLKMVLLLSMMLVFNMVFLEEMLYWCIEM